MQQNKIAKQNGAKYTKEESISCDWNIWWKVLASCNTATVTTFEHYRRLFSSFRLHRIVSFT